MTGGGGGRGHFSSFRAGAGRWLGWVGGSPRWPHLRLLVSPPLPPFPQEKGRRRRGKRNSPKGFFIEGQSYRGRKGDKKVPPRGDPPSPFFRRRRPAARDGNLGERGGEKVNVLLTTFILPTAPFLSSCVLLVRRLPL